MPNADAPAPPPRPARGEPVELRIDGRTIRAIEGEPLVRALYRAGVRTLTWSVKLHRPRTVLCARGRCGACQVEVDGRPGVSACRTRVRAGMDVRRQDFRPAWGALLHAAARTVPLPAGFYYRHFTRPAWVRRAFQAMLRRMAGVARVAADAPERVATADAGGATDARQHRRGAPGASGALSATIPERVGVLVVGAGLSGMAAALAAASAGADAWLVDDEEHPGGRWRGPLGDAALEARRDALVDALARSGVHVARGVTAQALHDGPAVTIAPTSGGAPRRVRAGAVVLAPGALDAIPLFRDNERPGVLGHRALRLLLERDGVVPGRVAVVWGEGPEADAACALLEAHGIALAARAASGDDARATLPNARPVATLGRNWIRAVEFATPHGRRRVACDVFCVVAAQPDFALARQAGIEFAFDTPRASTDAGDGGDRRVLVPRDAVAPSGRVAVVGEAAGRFDPHEAIAHAESVARALAQEVA